MIAASPSSIRWQALFAFNKQDNCTDVLGAPIKPFGRGREKIEEARDGNI
jgi:hypothetical protein